MKREFIVDTPLGKLKVHAKHGDDYPDDYPGAFVDLLLDNGEFKVLACVEYDSCRKRLQTCVFNPGCEVVAHNFSE